MNCKVTVLVAVYNMAHFLPKCLDSLIGQTVRDIQIVCVDDGSSDESLQLLSAYQEKDNRIEVIHLNRNRGLAYARNLGLQRAKGQYVCMLDADDWYAPDAFEQCVNVFENNPSTDCVLFKCMLVYQQEDGLRYELQPSKDFVVLSGQEACMLSLDWQIHGIYMVRTEIHKRYPYDDSARLYSDENTTRLHYAVSREVRQCQGTYFYLQHSGSNTHKLTSVRQFDRLIAKESLLRELVPLMPAKEMEIKQTITLQLWLILVDCYMIYHCYHRTFSPADLRHAKSELHRVWSAVDRRLLTSPKVRKFGYRPMPSWPLFRLQEWLYFTLRGFLHKNI